MHTLQCTSPSTPLSLTRTTVRIRVRKRDSQRLNEIAAAGPHTRPQGKTVLETGRLGEDEGGVCLADPRVGRSKREGRSESDIVLGGGGLEDREKVQLLPRIENAWFVFL